MTLGYRIASGHVSHVCSDAIVPIHTEAIKSPNIAPKPPPMTPAITVLPMQDSMPICMAFTICCSCSLMPALGFMAAGNAPTPPIPPGKDMLELVDHHCVGKRTWHRSNAVAKAVRCAAAAWNFCGVGAEDGTCRTCGAWHPLEHSHVQSNQVARWMW